MKEAVARGGFENTLFYKNLLLQKWNTLICKGKLMKLHECLLKHYQMFMTILNDKVDIVIIYGKGVYTELEENQFS